LTGLIYSGHCSVWKVADIMAFRTLCLLALLTAVPAVKVTPVEKVISLVEDLKTEVETDGKNEAKAYEEFACFCKTQSGAKSNAIITNNDNINGQSATIADKTQTKKNKIEELTERKAKQEKLAAELAETEARWAKEKAEFEAIDADLSKAIQGLKDAISAMQKTGGSAAAFIQAHAGVKKTLEMAMVMGTIKPADHKAVTAFLQKSSVDPTDPEYEYHSQGIIDICKKLLKDYTDNLDDITTEWNKTNKAESELVISLNSKMDINKNAMNQLDKDIEKLKKEIAQTRRALTEEEFDLSENELFLKDLTARCEARANDYDQRSTMRGDELTALTSALEILTNTVKAKDEANDRAFIQAEPAKAAKEVKPAAATEKKAETKKAAPAAKEVTKAATSFLQEASVKEHTSFLGKVALTQEDRRAMALSVLKEASQKSGSMALGALLNKVAADPFKKVKGLIQKLIERLLTESQAEATKKGFCDTELGKAELNRDNRFAEAKTINTELVALEAKRDFLENEIDELENDVKNEKIALKEATKERSDEKDENLETIKTAKEGFQAVNDALLVLKTFYKRAGRAAFVQESPVDAMKGATNPGFEGNYKGKQEGSAAIFALLETISSDFDRTVRQTTEAEEKSQRSYIEYMQTAKSSISSKETKTELDKEDLKTTNDNIKSGMKDLQSNMDLLDQALNELSDLKPVCIDSGMSYAERVQKRQDEMAALQKALCMLDEENVEPTC